VRRGAYLVAVVLVLSMSAACGGLRHRESALPPSGVSLPPEGLWRVRVVDDDGERFSGLLATRRDGASLHYGLLDGTGIKLLQATVEADGTERIESVVEAVRETRLPAYLSRAVERIFCLGPGSGNCVRRGLARLCESAPGPQVARRESRIGPFRLWSVEYILGDTRATPTVDRVGYAPWGQPRLQLQRLP